MSAFLARQEAILTRAGTMTFVGETIRSMDGKPSCSAKVPWSRRHIVEGRGPGSLRPSNRDPGCTGPTRSQVSLREYRTAT